MSGGIPAWISDPTHDSPLKDQFPALGFVPCPGDPPEAKHVTAVVSRTAKALEDIADVLHGTGEGDWKGKHADAFREQFDDDFRPKIDTAKKSFRKAATALRDWSEAMPEWQRKATALESLAQVARDKHEAMKGKLADLPPKPSIFDSPKDDAEARKREKTEEKRSDAEHGASTAEAELEKIRADARKLADDYRLQGQSVARRLDKAMDIAPDEPGALSKLGSALKGIGKALGKLDDVIAEAIGSVVDGAVKWIKENAYTIAALADVLSVLSAVVGSVGLIMLGLSVFFPPLAAPAAAAGVISGGLALGALTMHGAVRAATGDDQIVSNRTLAQDTLGVLPFGGAFKGVTKAVAASRLADHASNFGLIDSVAGLMGDPTALGYFNPRDTRQEVELYLPGGPMFVAFENAWKAGREKDEAAARQGK
ncbi:putative T7SS-secreted protein [Streptomyces sp. NPDC058284]|uniref:putative T7SS-secreted protein n=1 Tax=unclassified Streptomyces TaxID=2593676 RepID=UPI00364FA0D3